MVRAVTSLAHKLPSGQVVAAEVLQDKGSQTSVWHSAIWIPLCVAAHTFVFLVFPLTPQLSWFAPLLFSPLSSPGVSERVLLQWPCDLTMLVPRD